jgi:hypothetical protein
MVAHLDQKLGKVNGVICDLCSTPLIDKFSYYSVKFDYVEVDREQAKSGVVKHDKRTLDLDICPDCTEKLKQQVITNINKRQQTGVWSSQPSQVIQHTQAMGPNAGKPK